MQNKKTNKCKFNELCTKGCQKILPNHIERQDLEEKLEKLMTVDNLSYSSMSGHPICKVDPFKLRDFIKTELETARKELLEKINYLAEEYLDDPYECGAFWKELEKLNTPVPKSDTE